MASFILGCGMSLAVVARFLISRKDCLTVSIAAYAVSTIPIANPRLSVTVSIAPTSDRMDVEIDQ